jgi:hypothetical protein
MGRMKSLRLFCGLGFLLLLASNIWTISRWSESRGVYDDVCYLRQAHLFQKSGIHGLDTDIAHEDDRYIFDRLKEIGFPEWNDVKRIPCHTLIAKADKYVLQYPPGTGFMLALFPAGFQVIPLYVLANVTVFGFALLGLFRARDPASVGRAAVFGLAALYLMINPTKASYSVAPTMMVCAAAGYLTARLFDAGQRHRLVLTLLIGLLIGLSVNFRLPNLLLSAGYFLYLAGSFLRSRDRQTFVAGIAFGVAFLIGVAPTLIANAINAGSPFSTTYGGVDAVPPALDAAVLMQYLRDPQFALLAIAAGWTAWLWRLDRGNARQAAFAVGANLAVNLIFFMTHPIFTPYYTIPIAMLSLWTLLFVTLDLYGEAAADKSAFRQPARA